MDSNDKNVFVWKNSWLNWKAFILLFKEAKRSEKIILHSLFNFKWVLILNLFLYLSKKSYWVIWGGDLYQSQNPGLKQRIKEFFKGRVIRNLRGIVALLPGDYRLACKWYKTEAKLFQCIAYTSNIFKSREFSSGKVKNVVVQVGNSATKSNRHEQVMNKIDTSKQVEFIFPLSYGDKDYAERLVTKYSHLNANFLRELLPLNDYLKILEQVDIAIFNHDRQQAIGNIVNLLGLGKKVYLNSEVTTYPFFESIGIKIFDIEKEIELTPLDSETAASNRKVIEKYFSLRKLREDWQRIYQDG